MAPRHSRRQVSGGIRSALFPFPLPFPGDRTADGPPTGRVEVILSNTQPVHWERREGRGAGVSVEYLGQILRRSHLFVAAPRSAGLWDVASREWRELRQVSSGNPHQMHGASGANAWEMCCNMRTERSKSRGAARKEHWRTRTSTRTGTRTKTTRTKSMTRKNLRHNLRAVRMR